MSAITVTLQPGPNVEMLNKHLDVETAQLITGPEYHYSIAYNSNPDNRDEYNILVNGDYAGEINLYREGAVAHIGFWLRDYYRGLGAIREALRLMLTLYQGRFDFIQMTCWTNNLSAMALLDRIGMKEVRRLRYPRRSEEQYGEWTSHRRCTFSQLVAILNQDNYPAAEPLQIKGTGHV